MSSKDSSRMVAIITQSVFALKKNSKACNSTREEGKSMCLQKGSSAKSPLCLSYKANTLPEPHLLGKGSSHGPSSAPRSLLKTRNLWLLNQDCSFHPITSLPFGKILRSSETLILCYPQNVYILKEIYPEQCVCDCWQISLWEQNNLNPLKSNRFRFGSNFMQYSVVWQV